MAKAGPLPMISNLRQHNNTEEKKYHIVILDDNYIALSPYIAEIECLGIEVSVADNVIEWSEILAKGKSVDLFIIDIMLPVSGSGFSELATGLGQRTGLLVGKMLRKKGIDTPIIFFSVAWLEGAIKEIKNTENRIANSIYLQKQETLPEELATIIEAILMKGKVPGKFSKGYAKIIESMFLKPSFFGAGLDLKKLFK